MLILKVFKEQIFNCIEFFKTEIIMNLIIQLINR